MAGTTVAFLVLGALMASAGMAATALGYPAERLVAMQNVSASLLTMASAPRLGLALGLLPPEERDPGLFRRVLAVDAVALAALSGLSLLLKLAG